jgi:hypothetical protein
VDNSGVLPAYKLFHPEWTQHPVAELSSSREVVELPAQERSAELSAATPEYFEQLQPNIPELGIADGDSTHVSQFLAHGTYQPAELSTNTDFVFEFHNDSAAQNIQVDGWDLTPSNYNATPNDLLNVCFPNNDLSMTNAPTVDATCQQTPRTSKAIQPYYCTELGPAVEEGDRNGRCASTCDVFPMGRFTDSDASQGNSVFSASPSRSTSGTSVSSIDLIKTPQDNAPASFIYFLDEPDKMCQDPVEGFEPLESTKSLMNNLQGQRQGPSHFFLNESDIVHQEHIEEEFHWSEKMSISTSQSTSFTLASPWSSRSNSTTSQSFSSSYGYSSGMLHEKL